MKWLALGFLIDRCTVLMKWRPGDWMKWAFTEFQGRYHKSKNQNLEWIICGILKIHVSLIHEFTSPRTWFGHIYIFFGRSTKWKWFHNLPVIIISQRENSLTISCIYFLFLKCWFTSQRIKEGIYERERSAKFGKWLQLQNLLCNIVECWSMTLFQKSWCTHKAWSELDYNMI